MRVRNAGLVAAGLCMVATIVSTHAASALGTLPDGRTLTPIGFTIPVEGFASSEAMSPDGAWIAVLSQDGGAVDVLSVGEDARLVERLSIPWASGMTWTADGLYVTRGYTGIVARYAYSAELSKDSPVFTKRPDVHVGGLVNGIADDPASHRFVVARTAAMEVDTIDDRSDDVIRRSPTTGQPFSVGISGSTIVATMYDSAHIDVWPSGATSPIRVSTGPHPTELLVAGGKAYVANADGHDVAVVDIASHSVERRYDLRVASNPYAGQTPSGMAISADGRYALSCSDDHTLRLWELPPEVK